MGVRSRESGVGYLQSPKVPGVGGWGGRAVSNPTQSCTHPVVRPPLPWRVPWTLQQSPTIRSGRTDSALAGSSRVRGGPRRSTRRTAPCWLSQPTPHFARSAPHAASTSLTAAVFGCIALSISRACSACIHKFCGCIHTQPGAPKPCMQACLQWMNACMPNRKSIF